jgi:sterol desaturase/sphingolipid hydroxylase (fatty acid hydroxylase superfamily)
VNFLHELELRLLLLLGYFAIVFLVEAIATADEKNTFRNVLFNISHGVIYNVIDVSAGAYLTLWLVLLVKRVPFAGFIDLRLSDHGALWAALLLSFLSLAVYDFFYYWMHRLQHASRWLWAEHELHHSEEHMNVTTGVRHHHLEILLKNVLISLPLAILFRVPNITVILSLVLSGLFIYFIHANARIGLGPLNRVFANPQVHRIHHSKLPQHIDKNFAAYFPLWDVLFGTYYHPKRGEYPPVGLVSGRTVHSVWEAAWMPFVTWAKMLRKAKSVA